MEKNWHSRMHTNTKTRDFSTNLVLSAHTWIILLNQGGVCSYLSMWWLSDLHWSFNRIVRLTLLTQYRSGFGVVSSLLEQWSEDWPYVEWKDYIFQNVERVGLTVESWSHMHSSLLFYTSVGKRLPECGEPLSWWAVDVSVGLWLNNGMFLFNFKL